MANSPECGDSLGEGTLTKPSSVTCDEQHAGVDTGISHIVAFEDVWRWIRDMLAPKLSNELPDHWLVRHEAGRSWQLYRREISHENVGDGRRTPRCHRARAQAAILRQDGACDREPYDSLDSVGRKGLTVLSDDPHAVGRSVRDLPRPLGIWEQVR